MNNQITEEQIQQLVKLCDDDEDFRNVFEQSVCKEDIKMPPIFTNTTLKSLEVYLNADFFISYK